MLTKLTSNVDVPHVTCGIYVRRKIKLSYWSEDVRVRVE